MHRNLVRILVLAVLAMALLAAPARGGDHVYTDSYVAMGDSYASGVGTREYWDQDCQRSFYSYPQLLFKNWPRSTSLGFTNVTCGGDKTSDVLNDQIYVLRPDTNYVTIQIGGNDAGFGNVLKSCIRPWTSCNNDIQKANDFIRNTLPSRLDNVYRRIRQASPFAYVLVVGYPRLFSPKDCNGTGWLSDGEKEELNKTADLLRNVTKYVTAVQGSGFYFVDPISRFTGHGVCEGSNEWINGVSDPFGESFHPNRNGHSKGFYPLVAYTIALTR